MQSRFENSNWRLQADQTRLEELRGIWLKTVALWALFQISHQIIATLVRPQSPRPA